MVDVADDEDTTDVVDAAEGAADVSDINTSGSGSVEAVNVKEAVAVLVAFGADSADVGVFGS